MFPPGRARLLTTPRRTGSTETAITMGIVAVARPAATAAPLVPVTITSGRKLTISAASSSSRSAVPSALR